MFIIAYYNFGAVLKLLREEKGFSQEYAAELLSCSVSTISRIETGKQVPSFSLFETAMQMLGGDSQDYFSFVLDADEQFGYTKLIELRHLVVEGDFESLRILVSELEDKKPFGDRFFEQFLLFCKTISDETTSEEEKLKLLLDIIRMTKKNFDIADIENYLLTYNEITILGRIASAYFRLGDKEKAVQISYGTKNSMDKNYANGWEKSRTYPSLMYNLSKYLGQLGRHDEAFQACITARQWAIKYNKLKALPSILANLAHYYFLKEDFSNFREHILQAYFSARGMDQHRLANEIINASKNVYNFDIESITQIALTPRKYTSGQSVDMDLNRP